jgi:ribonuclease BN (tRNA processing enzyme)
VAELTPGRHGAPDGPPDAGAALSLTVLGCDGSWTGPGGAGSGYLVRSGATNLWMDAGPGTFARLQEHIDPASIDAVFISHHHPDHWTDLHALVIHARYALGREGIPIYAAAGLGKHTDLLQSRECEWFPLTDGDKAHIGELDLSFHRTDHTFETLAARIGVGSRALGYSADTGPGWTLAELGTGLGLVLCEATYTFEHEGTAGHMSGRQAGAQARDAGVRRLVITHRWPTIDAAAVATEAARAFGGPVEQAEIGKEYVL